jgi:methylphosphotriester-DNA--protein-cysteine methyltransferase
MNYWNAVAARDRALDGVFFYAVTSTGIYCRPSCPSKRPRRENVVFFRAREAAERAGFRPCKRCQPDSADPNAQLIEKVCRYIDTHPDDPVTLEALGRALGISPFHLQRTFKALTGISPRAYTPAELAQSRLAPGTLGYALALRCGLRVFQQALRTRYRASGHDAFALSQARLRDDDSLHGSVHADRRNVIGRHRARRLLHPFRR